MIDVSKFKYYAKHKDYNAIEVEDMSKEQRLFLTDLNTQLMKVEKELIKEAKLLTTQAEKRLADPDDWIKDYELECNITFYMSEDDPDFDEDSDNTLTELDENLKPILSDRTFFNGKNHSEFRHWEKHPMYGEHHCWLYHCLYDHATINAEGDDLGWADILSIGNIWVNINLEYQHFIKI